MCDQIEAQNNCLSVPNVHEVEQRKVRDAQCDAHTCMHTLWFDPVKDAEEIRCATAPSLRLPGRGFVRTFNTQAPHLRKQHPRTALTASNTLKKMIGRISTMRVATPAKATNLKCSLRAQPARCSVRARKLVAHVTAHGPASTTAPTGAPRVKGEKEKGEHLVKCDAASDRQ